MRDGYYVSTYLTPPGLPHVLDTWLAKDPQLDEGIRLWIKRATGATDAMAGELATPTRGEG